MPKPKTTRTYYWVIKHGRTGVMEYLVADLTFTRDLYSKKVRTYESLKNSKQICSELSPMGLIEPQRVCRITTEEIKEA